MGWQKKKMLEIYVGKLTKHAVEVVSIYHFHKTATVDNLQTISNGKSYELCSLRIKREACNIASLKRSTCPLFLRYNIWAVMVVWSKTRSSAIRRESAHLTWLYCTVQMSFQYETV